MGRNHLEDLVIDVRIILKWALKIKWENMDWIDLAEERCKWWAPVKTVLNSHVLKCGEFLDQMRNCCGGGMVS